MRSYGTRRGRRLIGALLAAAATCTTLLASPAAAAQPTSTQQIFVTGSIGSSRAVLDTYQYGQGAWHHTMSTPAQVGRRGLSANECEGCGYTPIGTFGFGLTLFGVSTVSPNPRFTYRHLVCGDWWDERSESPTYNQFVQRPCGAPGPGGNSEALWTETVAYQHFALITYNLGPAVPGRGSGIFLHDATRSGVTAGCVGIAPGALENVLRWLDPAQRPTIRIGTSPGPR